MADFDNFASSGAPQEEDPAAEFLAREQNQMAGLEDDFGPAQPAPAAGNGLFTLAIFFKREASLSFNMSN